MDEATTTSDPASPPGPKDRPAADTPHVNALLGLVQKLILIGKALIETMQHTNADPVDLTFRFGTSNIRLILGRIIRGLHRAAALEQRLRERAASGRDLKPSEPGGSPPPPPSGVGRHRPPDPQEQEVMLSDAELHRIIREARCRPVGAVITDLCIEFGVMPGSFEDTALMALLGNAMMQFRGSLERWHREAGRYLHRVAQTPYKPQPDMAMPTMPEPSLPKAPGLPRPTDTRPMQSPAVTPPLPHLVPATAKPP